MDHLHAAVFEILHNLFVMNNRPEGVDRLFTALNFTVYRIDRPFDAEAEACTFCNSYFHLFFFSSFLCRVYMRSRARLKIFSTTSLIVISELSTSTASSACTSGECSLCMS